MKWYPDTCYCAIQCGLNSLGNGAPNVNGKFIQRCRLHQNSRNTMEVYNHSLSLRIKSTETNEAGQERKRLVKESTRP